MILVRTNATRHVNSFKENINQVDNMAITNTFSFHSVWEPLTSKSDYILSDPLAYKLWPIHYEKGGLI